MSLEKALREKLEPFVPNVVPLIAPEGMNTPYIVYKSSEGVQERGLEGNLAIKDVEVELHIVASSYSEMKDKTKLVLSDIKNWQRVKIGTDQIFVQTTTYTKPVEIYENETKTFHCFFDITITI